MAHNFNHERVNLMQVIDLANAIGKCHDLDYMYESIYFHAKDADNKPVVRLEVEYEGYTIEILDRSYFELDTLQANDYNSSATRHRGNADK